MSNTKSTGGQRIVSLDLLRGLAVAGMILVDSPGSWSKVYPPLEHAAWHGFTAADLVFPTFLFCAGMAVGLMVPRMSLEDRSGSAFWLKVAKRTGLLILLGLVINLLGGHFDLPNLRLPGILQRIGVCYALGTAICVLAAKRGEGGNLVFNMAATFGAAVVLLATYWLLVAFVPVPGFGAGHLDSYKSLPAFLDRAVFTIPHLWRGATTEGLGVTYDPEGLLSTLPAVVNVLMGAVAARVMMRGLTNGQRGLMPVLVLGVALVVIGLALNPVMPINKKIWTPSFAILTGGLSTVILVGFEMVARSRSRLGFDFVLKVLGGNAILAFILCQLLGIFSDLKIIPGANPSPQGFGNALALTVLPDPYQASLACAVLVLAFITAILIPLHRKGIHLRL
ncbi:acyltransferase family protein [Caulobacter segnis]